MSKGRRLERENEGCCDRRRKSAIKWKFITSTLTHTGGTKANFDHNI